MGPLLSLPWVHVDSLAPPPLDAFRSCLQMANLVDSEDKWAGGETVVVQVCK